MRDEERQRDRDNINEWKTGLTDDLASEKHLSKLKDEFERLPKLPKYLKEN
jgi:hypothetical protein